MKSVLTLFWVMVMFALGIWIGTVLASCATTDPIGSKTWHKRTRFCEGTVIDWVTMQNNCERENQVPIFPRGEK